MQMNLDLAPACVTVVGQPFDQGLVVLLGGIKIRVTKRAAFIIAPWVNQPRILPAPILEAAFLLVVGSSSRSVLRHNPWLEVVSQYKDQMHYAARKASNEPLPSIIRKPPKRSIR